MNEGCERIGGRAASRSRTPLFVIKLRVGALRQLRIAIDGCEAARASDGTADGRKEPPATPSHAGGDVDTAEVEGGVLLAIGSAALRTVAPA